MTSLFQQDEECEQKEEKPPPLPAIPPLAANENPTPVAASNEKSVLKMVPVSNEKPIRLILANEKAASVILANEKTAVMPTANKKPSRLLTANENPASLLTANEKEGAENGSTFVSLTDLEAFHLKQCRNKVGITFLLGRCTLYRV